MESGQYLVALINGGKYDLPILQRAWPNAQIEEYKNGFEFLSQLPRDQNYNLILSKGHYRGPNCFSFSHQINSIKAFDNTLLVFDLVDIIDDEIRKDAMRYGVTEIFDRGTTDESKIFRLNFLLNNPYNRHKKNKNEQLVGYKTPIIKRLFDIAVSATAILLVSPVLILVAILIKLESKGPVIYHSPRVGTGYKIFKFYKFRSMYTGADQRLKNLSHLNQYNNEEELVAEPDQAPNDTLFDSNSTKLLYMDGKSITEDEYAKLKKNQTSSPFVKIKNDPRITKVGQFIRNTSIDELPQLWNVLKGDMSIVGNRPLPMYEAEKLTTDRFALRFMAPAGITGLWQVTKRGKGDMSQDERMQLDNDYANDSSFRKDIILILKTIPALLQKENV